MICMFGASINYFWTLANVCFAFIHTCVLSFIYYSARYQVNKIKTKHNIIILIKTKIVFKNRKKAVQFI